MKSAKEIYEEGMTFQDLKRTFVEHLIQLARLPQNKRFVLHMDIKVVDAKEK